MSKQKRLTFSREFKLEAVRQLELGEKPAADLASELGAPHNRLYKWREQLQAKDADTASPARAVVVERMLNLRP